MKAIRYILLPMMLFAAAACHKVEKEMDPIPEVTPAQEKTSLTFISERPQPAEEEGTRTYWDDDAKTILWNGSDRIRIGYTVKDIWQNAKGDSSGDAKLYASDETVLSEEGAVAAFAVSGFFEGNTEGKHVFYGIYPGFASGATMTDAPTTIVTVPSSQTPLANSFDPNADVMLGHSIGEYDARPTEPILLVWNRVVAHGLITLKTLPGIVSGEAVKSVTLTAQSGANLTGDQEMNVITGHYSPATENTTPNRVVIKGDNLSLDASGNVTFWMAILPETLTALTVEVVTNKATYTRSISGFTRTFLANRRNILSINMASASRRSSEEVYSLVTKASELGEGHYLIAYTADNKTACVLSGKGSGNYGGYVESVSITNDAISYDTYKTYDVEIKSTSSGYTLQLGGKYLGFGDKALYFDTTVGDRNYWSVSVSSSGTASIVPVSGTNYTIQWNSSSPRFSCYSSSQKAIRLYKWTPSTPNVTTGAATDITVSSAVLNATFANLGTTNVQDVLFMWGETAGSLNQEAFAEDFDVTAGGFHATLSSLEENKTYYYKAVLQYCMDGVNYQTLEGEVLSFTTRSSETGGDAGLQWLGCYEIPAIALMNENSYSGTGKETFGDTHWFNYETTNSDRKVVTHTYEYEGKVYRNYTAMVDKTKRCPLWTAYVMHSTAYPDNNVGRAGSFNTSHSYDPGIPKAWQSSGSTGDYSTANFARGHMCASNDRQATEDANKQTFYYTNQSPQKQDGFNGGIWEQLEGAVQSHAPSGRDTLYVVVGTLFEDNNYGASNDGGQVARPSHFYKLLMKCTFNASGTMTNAKGIAYLYTNEDHSNDNGGRTVTYHDSRYVTTIRAIEDRTGFNFFANVPADLQNAAEQTATALWTY